eukprot:Hpha_TRINITY_DN1533_c0_g1::TRINITY_DN1533_c0_g1_i1::g.57243::m.57243
MDTAGAAKGARGSSPSASLRLPFVEFCPVSEIVLRCCDFLSPRMSISRPAEPVHTPRCGEGDEGLTCSGMDDSVLRVQGKDPWPGPLDKTSAEHTNLKGTRGAGVRVRRSKEHFPRTAGTRLRAARTPLHLTPERSTALTVTTTEAFAQVSTSPPLPSTSTTNGGRATRPASSSTSLSSGPASLAIPKAGGLPGAHASDTASSCGGRGRRNTPMEGEVAVWGEEGGGLGREARNSRASAAKAEMLSRVHGRARERRSSSAAPSVVLQRVRSAVSSDHSNARRFALLSTPSFSSGSCDCDGHPIFPTPLPLGHCDGNKVQKDR